ncbi:MAG TPA: hypothetical protein VK887_08965 [Pseudonocardiaceae bacterium]|jgi:hypothetical protein|nr:hypothetical protein [Pseudonocardiaceae bacterium]
MDPVIEGRYDGQTVDVTHVQQHRVGSGVINVAIEVCLRQRGHAQPDLDTSLRSEIACGKIVSEQHRSGEQSSRGCRYLPGRREP